MQKRTTLFVSLIIAMIVLLVLAWYTWPDTAAMTPAAQPSQGASVASSTPATTTPTATGTASSYPPPSLGESNGIVQIDGQIIYVVLAENPAQQELGLGNRPGLGAQQGMLFIFPNDAQHEFWMKDMSFSIDMIWFSADGTIIYIQPDTAPDTYPEAFGPGEVSRYVLEVPANFAAGHGIKVGDKATLP